MRINHRSLVWMAVLLIFAMGIAIYSNSLDGQFVFDDIPHILENRHIRLTQFDAETIFKAAFKSPLANRPVANVSFALNYYWGRLSVFGYHLFNIFIHILNAILVFALAREILGRAITIQPSQPVNFLKSPSALEQKRTIALAALFAALLFVAHPIQTQTVAYTVQRMNSLAVMFYLGAFLFYLYGRSTSVGWKKWIFLSGSLMAWLLGLGSKEIAITFPFAIWLYEWFFMQNLSRKWLIKSRPYFLGLILIALGLVFIFMKGLPLENIINGYATRDFTMGERVVTQLRVFILYLSLFFFPHPSRLNLEHAFSVSHSLVDPPTTLAAFIFIMLLFGAAIWQARPRRLLSFCIFWIFLHLVVESSVIGLEMVFEHRLYLPMFAFALLGGYAFFRAFSLKPGRALVVALAVILLLGTASHIRNRAWYDSATLWADVISKNPKSARAHYNLGSHLVRANRLRPAAEHFVTALKLNPQDKQAHVNLGIVLSRQNDDTAAMAHYRKALAIDPEFAIAFNNIGFLYEQQNQLEPAMVNYQKALEIKPDLVEARNNLGNVLEKQNRTDEALYHYLRSLQVKTDGARTGANLALALTQKRSKKDLIGHYLEALEQNPKSHKLYNDLGVLLMEENITQAAMSCFDIVLRLDPVNEKAHNNLGVAQARLGFHDKAVHHYEEALRLNPDYAEAHNNLGIALTRQKSYPKAIYHFEQALQRNPQNSGTKQNLAIARKKMAE